MGKLTIAGTAKARGYNQVDARLRDIIAKAAERSPYDVEVFSGKRFGGGGSRHDRGHAVDIVLLTPDGVEIPNLASKEGFAAYQGFALIAKKIQQEKYSELNNEFRWGGFFSPSSKNPSGFDLMHFDLRPGAPMAYGSFEGGLNNAGRRQLAKLGDGRIYSSRRKEKAPAGRAYANLWPNQPTFAYSRAEDRTLRHRPDKLIRGDDVEALQQTLDELGYDPGPADGVFGDQTETAVKAFQTANNLDVDGVAGPQTINAAQAPNVVRADGKKQAPSLFGRGPLVGGARAKAGIDPDPALDEFGVSPPAPVVAPGTPIPRPRRDPSPVPRRSETLRLPTRAVEREKPSRKSVVAEIEEIQEKMRSDRRGYFADEALQARYRELIAMRDRNRLVQRA